MYFVLDVSMEGITKYMRHAPFIINLVEKVKVVVEEVPLESLPAIYKFYCKYAASMNGVSVDEFEGKEDFIKKLSTRDNYCMREEETRRLIACVQVSKYINYYGIFYIINKLNKV